METKTRLLFDRKYLFKLIFPLLIEQVLAVMIGMADTVMVARVGEASVSAVALVDSVNILIFQIFAALATGGAVICSQYLGRKDIESAQTAARQLVLITVCIGIVLVYVRVRWVDHSEFAVRSCRGIGDVAGGALFYFVAAFLSVSGAV